ncbi:MAG: aspartate aminotransferase family protein, partial [Gammaproteobacteria bacterium]|nr:aspartate aminotransferase family protein [Gammaproteobacteria bacterium]
MKNALPLTEEIIEMDKAHHLRPYLNFDTLEEGALPIERAEGINVWDTDGKKYVDAIGGMWCVNIGAGSKEMA